MKAGKPKAENRKAETSAAVCAGTPCERLILPPAGRDAHSWPYPLTKAGFWLLASGLLAFSSGCGYSSSGLYRENIRTVYIEMFQSKEFRRGIEFQLTEALRKQIDRSTPYRNAEKEKADTVLSGEVLDWREATLGRSPLTDLPRETAATLAIRYRWQDMRTGKILVDQPRFVTTVTYIRPVGETVFHARDEAVNKMARRVVETMETPW